MKGHKQSFLERLTGAHVITPETSDEPTNMIPSTRLWSTAVYTEEENEAIEYAQEETGGNNEGEEAGLAIDVYEYDSELIIQAMVAGVTPENLNITITRDHVSIRGLRVAPREIADELHHVRELYWGAFAREIDLPFEVDTEKAEAVEKYGLLIIRLPKLNSNKMQELKVKSI